MIDEKKLMELRIVGSQHVAGHVRLDDVLDTLEALWKVARVAENIPEGITRENWGHFDDLASALAALHEPSEKGIKS